MTMIGNDFPVRANAFCLNSEKRASSADMSPAGTLCFDIFPPPPGDSEVISQVERLSSKEMKIAPRSVWMALGASGRSAIICMAVSRVGGRNLTLPERRSLSTSPWDLDALLPVLYLRGISAGDFQEVLTASVSYTHLRAHETRHDLVCRLLL